MHMPIGGLTNIGKQPTQSKPLKTNKSQVDLVNPRPFESIFGEAICTFHTKINFTKDEEEVFDLLVEMTKQVGFEGVVYEYCEDVFADEPQVMVRTNFKSPLLKFEAAMRKRGMVGYGREHATEKWTPMVGGVEFIDLFNDIPSQQWKYRMGRIATGLRSGMGFSLRSPDVTSRAGTGFMSKMTRAELEKNFWQHGWALHSASWAAHIRMLQHANLRKMQQDTEITERQMEYLRLLATGLLDKQIAHEMGISHSAVRKHQAALQRILGATRRTELITRAIETGLLESRMAATQMPDPDWNTKLTYTPKDYPPRTLR